MPMDGTSTRQMPSARWIESVTGSRRISRHTAHVAFFLAAAASVSRVHFPLVSALNSAIHVLH